MKRSLIIIIALLTLLTAGCATRLDGTASVSRAFSSEEKAIEQAVKARESSVRNRDAQAFKALIDDGGYHPTYPTEQERWMQDAIYQGIGDFTCSIEEMEYRSGKYWYVRLLESYTMDGREYECSYPVVYRLIQDGDGYNALICGYDFQTMENDYAIFYFAEANRGLITELCQMSSAEFERVYKTFGYTPAEKLIVNIYPGQKHMIWSVKPSLPSWVGGWAESEESVKMCCFGMYTPEEYMDTLAHEACHMVVSEISGNNACYWLHEGLAGMMEDEGMDINSYDRLVLRMNENNGSLMGFEDIQYEDYEALDDQFVVGGYYASCKVMACALKDEYGMDGIVDMLRSLDGSDGAAGFYSLSHLRAMSDLNIRAMEELWDTNADALSGLFDDAMDAYLGDNI